MAQTGCLRLCFRLVRGSACRSGAICSLAVVALAAVAGPLDLVVLETWPAAGPEVNVSNQESAPHSLRPVRQYTRGDLQASPRAVWHFYRSYLRWKMLDGPGGARVRFPGAETPAGTVLALRLYAKLAGLSGPSSVTFCSGKSDVEMKKRCTAR